jgi:PQQ-dependent dehydrogenase (methanol/ethanol family)
MTTRPLTILNLAGLAAILIGRGVFAAGADPSASEWRFIGNNLDQQHFSSLRQINDQTVRGLALAWYADMPTPDGMTGVPLVAGGLVYQSGALGKVFANDVRTGKLVWSFDAHIPFPLPVIASWGARLTRGLALWEEEVITATGDCRLIALDRATGRQLWETRACDPGNFKTITGAPRIGGGKVFIGNSNADSGIGRGHVDAFDAKTGKHLWRFFTIPGDPAAGFESKAMAMASKTWGKDYWKIAGGGSAWDGITYDSKLNLLFVGTDGPAPFDPTQRGVGRGDELFTNSIVALNADTGQYVWHYQTTPDDGWNYAAAMPIMIADLTIRNRMRRVVMQAPKNGFFYVLDAKTGKLINQPKNIVPVNWASHIDMKTGRPVQLADAKYWLADQHRAVVSPSPMGAHSWMPMSYNPATGLVYIPVMDMPTLMSTGYEANKVGALDIDFYYALTHKLPFKGSLLAYDPVAQKPRWQLDVGFPYEGGTLTTAGNLVFQGTTSGYLSVYRADSGEKLWSMFTGSGILGAPSTVEIDGEQLIIVAVGSGSTAAIGFARRFSSDPGGPARLLAFKLNGKAELPILSPREAETIPEPPRPRPDPALAAQGKDIWGANSCELCHGFNMIGGLGSVPDLRRASAQTHSQFAAIVLAGLRKDKGMPVFSDSIGLQDLPALQAYVLEQAWRAYDEQNAHAPSNGGH